MRLRCWDKEKKIMLPSFPLYKACFAHYDRTAEMIIMLGTGLKDRTGKEIYEGDKCSVTLSTGRKVNAFVAFVDGCFELQFVSPIENGRYNYMDYLKCHTVNLAVEVIGNIYESPELMGEIKEAKAP